MTEIRVYIVTTDDYDLILNRETMLLKEVR